MSEADPLKVVLLGCGVVGSQVARLLLENADAFAARSGRALELVGIGVRRAGVERPGIDPALITTDVEGLVSRPGVDLVIEVMGGLEPARSLIRAAIANGASVITANKALLATDPALFAEAAAAGVDLYYEAAVAGAIPIIRPLRESLVGDEVTAVSGIVNGTTNYILDQMHTQGWTFSDALAEAKRLGFAEADPTADVEGFDAAAKAALLASLAFHTRVTLDDVEREGITKVSAADVATATSLGYVIKLIARAAVAEGGAIEVGVHPTLVPAKHPLAAVPGAFNAVFIESRNAGQLMFMGPGAGGSPTASAVLGDVVTAARNVVRGVAGPGEASSAVRPIASGAASARFYVSLVVADEPGVLATIAAVFAGHQVSIQAVRQTTNGDADVRPDEARLAIMTHTATIGDMQAALAELAELNVVDDVTMMRVEGQG